MDGIQGSDELPTAEQMAEDEATIARLHPRIAAIYDGPQEMQR